MTVRLTGLAASDLSEIRGYYRAIIDDDIERRFLDQFDLVVERLLSFPGAHRQLTDSSMSGPHLTRELADTRQLSRC